MSDNKNEVTLTGYVGKYSKFKKVGNDMSLCNLSLSTGSKKKGGGYDYAITNWNIWKESADDFVKQCRVEDKVTMVGYIIPNNWNGTDGKAHRNLTFNCKSFTFEEKGSREQNRVVIDGAPAQREVNGQMENVPDPFTADLKPKEEFTVDSFESSLTGSINDIDDDFAF